MTNEDDLVQIYVPRAYLMKVYGFLSELEHRDSAHVATREGPPREWTPDLVQRAYEESPQSMKRIFRKFAQHPEEELTTSELARALSDDADWNTVAGTFGAFGRRVRNRYGMDEMPFTQRWDTDEGRAYYLMRQEIASTIAAISGAGRGSARRARDKTDAD